MDTQHTRARVYIVVKVKVLVSVGYAFRRKNSNHENLQERRQFDALCGCG